LEPRGVMEDWITEVAVDIDDLDHFLEVPTFFDDLVQKHDQAAKVASIRKEKKRTVFMVLFLLTFGGAFLIGVPMLVYYLTDSGWWTTLSVPFTIWAMINPGEAFGFLGELAEAMADD